MHLLELIDLVRDAADSTKLDVLCNSFPALEEEDRECAFFLYLTIQNRASFISDCIKSATTRNAEQIISLSLEAEKASVPLTAFIFLFQTIAKAVNDAYGEPFYH